MTALDAGILGFLIGAGALGVAFIVAAHRSRLEPPQKQDELRTRRLAKQPDHWVR